MDIDAVIGRLNKLKRKEGTWVRVARTLGVSPQYLSDVVNKNRNPGDSLLTPLKLTAVIDYKELK